MIRFEEVFSRSKFQFVCGQRRSRSKPFPQSGDEKVAQPVARNGPLNPWKNYWDFRRRTPFVALLPLTSGSSGCKFLCDPGSLKRGLWVACSGCMRSIWSVTSFAAATKASGNFLLPAAARPQLSAELITPDGRVVVVVARWEGHLTHSHSPPLPLGRGLGLHSPPLTLDLGRRLHVQRLLFASESRLLRRLSGRSRWPPANKPVRRKPSCYG